MVGFYTRGIGLMDMIGKCRYGQKKAPQSGASFLSLIFLSSTDSSE
jgi:hypothetical protein